MYSNLMPFDVGGQVFSGIVVDRIGITIGYQIGVVDVFKSRFSYFGLERIRAKNSTIYLNLSYLLRNPAKRT
jgi:hypothetical protein